MRFGWFLQKFLKKRHRYYARYYYYQREIEGFHTYENLLSLYDPGVKRVIPTEKEISLGGIKVGFACEPSVLKDERSIVIYNQNIPSHFMVIKRDLFENVKLKLIYHFLNNIFFYGKLLVPKITEEISAMIYRSLLEKYDLGKQNNAPDEELLIAGKNGMILFTPFSEEVCTYIENVDGVAYRQIVRELELEKRSREKSRERLSRHFVDIL